MNFNLGNSHPDEDCSKMDEIPSLGIGIKIISQIADELSYAHF
jgi:hypothetical protein